jgi:outer membrane protein assembly factor BamB
LWAHQYPVDYQSVSYDIGPRSTPTVHEQRVYSLGAVGHLHCLDAETGEIRWSKDLVNDHGARIPLWGLSASPLIYENLVIVHAGLEPGGCYAAFDRTTGEEQWRCLPDGAGYATPILIDRHGTTELVGWTPNHVRGMEPATGKTLWSIPFEVNYGTAIADPIFQEGVVLVSSYYDGTKAIRLGDASEQAEVVWDDRRNLRALMAQPLYREGHVYLIDKRHGLTCLELKTGKKLWDDQNQLTPKGRNPQATLVWLNDEDRAIVLNSDGELILSRFNPRASVETARANIIDQTWAHPAYAGNCVYARSDTRLVCVVLPEE